MANESNQQIIEGMFKNYVAGNMSAVLSCFDKDIVWIRPGAPVIPFAGTFNGINELMQMFAIQATEISVQEFIPDQMCTSENMVVVLGHDKVNVISTGKSYAARWVQAYTFKGGKIINVEVFMDTKVVADAFAP